MRPGMFDPAHLMHVDRRTHGRGAEMYTWMEAIQALSNTWPIAGTLVDHAVSEARPADKVRPKCTESTKP